MKPAHSKSWAGNLLVWSDLALDVSFKVRQWFTGFGEVSFKWILFALVLRCAGASFRYKINQIPLYQYNVKTCSVLEFGPICLK